MGIWGLKLRKLPNDNIIGGQPKTGMPFIFCGLATIIRGPEIQVSGFFRHR